jgi:outer membrane receptor for ferrienterochelin and colicins
MKNIAFLSLLLFHTLFNSVKATPDPDRENRVQNLLLLSLEELMQMEITTAGKTLEKIGEIPASVVLITRQDIQRYGYSTLDDILRHVSGVYSIDFYGLGGAAYGVRGYLSTGASNRNIIILINGISQILDSDSTFLIPSSPVPVEAIDRIEIIRGAQSTIYGSGAFFGVINIITNEVSQKEGFKSYVSALTGSEQTRRWFGRTSYANDKGKVVLNVGHYQKGGLNVPYNRLESESIGYESGLSTGGRLELAQKYFEISGNYQNLSFDLTHADINEEGFVSAPTIGSGTLRKSGSTHLRLGYKTDLSEHLSLNSKLTYIRNKTFVNFDSPYPVPSSILNIEDDRSTAYEGEITLLWKKPKQLDLIGGIYYRYAPKVTNYVDVPILENVAFLQKSLTRLQSGDAVVNRALFSQLNYYPNEQWKWVAGLRLEQVLGYGAFAEYGNGSQYESFTPHYDNQKLAIIPRFAAIYTPDEKNIFKWMYSKAINSPSFGQNTSSRLTSELPSLQAERIETYEFNYITYLSQNYMISANLFHNRLENLFGRIDAITPSGEYTNFLGNGGKWTTNGLELSLHAQPTEQMKLELSATYQKTKDLNYPTIEAAYSPRLLGQIKGSYQFNKQLSLGLTGFYVSKMEVFFDPTLKNPDGSFGGRINGTPSKNYLMAGANLRYQDWLSKGTFLNLRINNLFNQEITYPTYTRNTWIDKGSVGEKRNFMLTLGYEF